MDFTSYFLHQENLEKQRGNFDTNKVPPLEDVMKLRSNQNVYKTFIAMFMPCVTKKSRWDKKLASARGIREDELYTNSNEAFALLLLENSYSRWIDVDQQKLKPTLKGTAP